MRISDWSSDVCSSDLLPPGDWPTLIDGLCARFPAIPREQWRDRFARGRVPDRDGAPLAAVHPYRVGMELRYFREVPDEEPIPFRETVLHADAALGRASCRESVCQYV